MKITIQVGRTKSKNYQSKKHEVSFEVDCAIYAEGVKLAEALVDNALEDSTGRTLKELNELANIVLSTDWHILSNSQKAEDAII